MTAAAITRIISQLKSNGRTSAIVVCPFCEGGTRKRRTLSVDLRDGVWLYLCHRGSCPTKGAVPAIGNDGRPLMESVRTFEPRRLDMEYRTPYESYGDPIALRLVGMVDNVPEFATRHGLRVGLGLDHGTHVWIVRNVKGEQLGHVTRNEVKKVLTWREVDSPFYGYFYPKDSTPSHEGTTVVVEDPLSAALLAEEGFRAVALHGTNLSREAAAEIVYGSPHSTRYLVALDPDAAGAAASLKVMDRFRSMGATVYRWSLDKDVNKMTMQERVLLSERIEEAMPND